MCRVSILRVAVLGVAALLITGGSAVAQTPPCDVMTGGGFVVRPSGAKANFGVAGGCKQGSPTFGHLEYIDHSTGLNVHWTSITAYLFVAMGTPGPNGQPTGTRQICGTARTNNQAYLNVNFVVTAKDAGEPSTNDEFTIRLTTPVGGSPQTLVYTTESDSSHNLGGGNIQLHNPNPSTTGSFGGSCPALPGGIM